MKNAIFSPKIDKNRRNFVIIAPIPCLIRQECEGLQAILIDWQGGFLGSVANDLMWALYPFLEANSDDKVSYGNMIIIF
jgi:hypothetical protein